MKFPTSTASALLVLSLSNGGFAAPLAVADEPLEARAGGGSRVSSAGKAIGSTLLGAGFASNVGTVLSCLQSGKGKKCFGIGLRARDEEEYTEEQIEADTILALQALAHMLPTAASNSTGTVQERGFSSASKAIGTTVLGAGFGSIVSTTLSCLEAGKGKKCFGLKTRDFEDGTEFDAGSEHEVELLNALATTLKAGTDTDSSTLAVRASGGSAAGRAGKSIGKTLFGAGLGATVGTTLSCLESGKGKKCFGLKARDVEDDEDDEITELMARGAGSAAKGAAKGAGSLVGTTLLGSIVSTSVGSIVRCLESGKGKKCFARMAKRADASELHPDTIQFLQLISELAASQGATAENMTAVASTIDERGIGSFAKSAGKTGGSIAGGAIFSNLVNCAAQGRLKKCIKSIF